LVQLRKSSQVERNNFCAKDARTAIEIAYGMVWSTPSSLPFDTMVAIICSTAADAERASLINTMGISNHSMVSWNIDCFGGIFMNWGKRVGPPEPFIINI
jgi:hypothetical protein